MHPPSVGAGRGLLVFLAALALGTVAAVLTLRFQTELLPLFPQDSPAVRELREAERGDPRSGDLLVVFPEEPSAELRARLAAELERAGAAASATYERGMGVAPQRWAAWLLAAQDPADFIKVRQRLEPASAADQLDRSLENLAGALDEDAVLKARLDPLGLLPEEVEFSAAVASPAAPSPPLVLRVRPAVPAVSFESAQALVELVRRHLDRLGADGLITGKAAFTAEISREMRFDVVLMFASTVVLLVGIFWLAYRSLRPLGWIFGVLGIGIACALVSASLAFGELNVISIAFAAILLGLGIDYTLLIYHHFSVGEKSSPGDFAALRRGVVFSAFTTAGAFGLLAYSDFPGLRQLAVLVAVGLPASAAASLVILPARLAARPPAPPSTFFDPLVRAITWWARQPSAWAGSAAAAAALLLAAGILAAGPSWYDPSPARLQPTHTEAWQGQQALLAQKGPMELPEFLFTVTPERLAANRAAWNPPDTAALFELFRARGLDETWWAPTRDVLAELNRWAPGEWEADLIRLGAWNRLRHDLNAYAMRDFRFLGIAAAAIVLVMSWLAVRHLRDFLLILLGLGATFLLFGGAMWLTGAQLTLLSLLYVPLLIGLSVDYALHLILAARQPGATPDSVIPRLGLPILLAALTSIAGFGAPCLTRQPALQNFGLVMMLGVTAAATAALVVLPPLLPWSRPAAGHYSRLYHPLVFAGLARLARVIPRAVPRRLAGMGGWLYGAAQGRKRKVVEANLQLLNASANPRRDAIEVYARFAETMTDYFYIGARPREAVLSWGRERRGYENILEARDRGKGALIITPHLGLFEVGGLVMEEQGLPFAALTLPEPHPGLTRWRAAYRRRWSAGTVEVGTEPFALLPALQLLRKGHFLAALIDRPYPGQEVLVQLPGGPAAFSGNILLLAMMARCPVVPATVVSFPDGTWRFEAFPLIDIEDRGSREATVRYYTQKIADVFLPTLCQYRTQWFQFVPLAPSASSSGR